jgi:release factor glutamine methyltransferase
MINKIVDLGYSRLEAEELVSVSNNIEEDYKKLLNKYPIQYLIGYVNFYGYKIYVNEDVLIPRYETEFLVEKTIKYYKEVFNNKVNVLDIGTGSGAISVALKKNIDCDVTACDISKKALEVAKNNAKSNNVVINYIESDIFNNINDKYDIIISNPPYIANNEEVDYSVDKYEPHIALYAKDNGLYFYKEIIKNASNCLNDKFIIAFEIGYQQAEDIIKIIDNNFTDVKTIVEKDLSGKDRYLFIIKD